MPPTTCLQATDLRFLFSNLYNFRLNNVVEAMEPANQYENITAASCLRTYAAEKGGYGQDTVSVHPSQAKCEVGITASLGSAAINLQFTVN